MAGLLIGSTRKAPLIRKIGNHCSQKNLVMMSLYEHASSVQTLGVPQCHLSFWVASINVLYTS